MYEIVKSPIIYVHTLYMHYECTADLSSDKNVGKFREWLSLQSATGQRPGHDVMEVLGYLAYDTVREVRLSER